MLSHQKNSRCPRPCASKTSGCSIDAVLEGACKESSVIIIKVSNALVGLMHSGGNIFFIQDDQKMLRDKRNNLLNQQFIGYQLRRTVLNYCDNRIRVDFCSCN